MTEDKAEELAREIATEMWKHPMYYERWVSDLAALLRPYLESERADRTNTRACVSCGKITEWCCADCRINKGISVYVCESPECRNKHEANGQCSLPAPPEGGDER